MKVITVPTMLLFLFGFTNFNYSSLNIHTAKSLAKAAVNKYYSRAQGVVIEIKEWDYDNYRDRYRIKFSTHFKEKNDFGFWIKEDIEDLYLKCDSDGRNAIFGRLGFWNGFEVKWTSVYD